MSTCERCGVVKPEWADLWAACGDGPVRRDKLRERELALLRSKLSTAEAKLVDAERENKAWRALAGNRVAGYGSEMSARGEEGTDSFEYVFGAEHRGTGNWIEVTSGSKQNAAVYLATKLGLIDKGAVDG